MGVKLRVPLRGLLISVEQLRDLMGGDPGDLVPGLDVSRTFHRVVGRMKRLQLLHVLGVMHNPAKVREQGTRCSLSNAIIIIAGA